MAEKAPAGGKSGAAEKELGARPKERKGRVVPSRYMDYEKKADSKSALESTLEVPKVQEKSFRKPTTKDPRGKVSTALQSTFLDNHGGVLPCLEVSAIRAKTPASDGNKKPALTKKQTSSKRKQAMADTLIQIQDSRSLLLTFASLQMEKNLAVLEREGEEKLAVLLKERDRIQKEVLHKKRLLAEMERQKHLNDALEVQLEALGPIEEHADRFQQQYTTFATALDATRHELPVKEAYVPEDKGKYLADLEKALLESKELLEEALGEPSKNNAQVQSLAQELQKAVQEVAQELPRAFSEVVELSADVSKDVSLGAQLAGEEAMGLDAAKRLYFG